MSRTGAVERAMAAVGQRIGCSTSQAYTASVAAFVAVTLLLTVTLPALRQTVMLPARADAAPAALAAEPTDEAGPGHPVTDAAIGPPDPSAAPPPLTDSSAPDPTDLGRDEDQGASTECPVGPLLAAADVVVAVVDGAVGGVLPDASLRALMAVLTGCSADDPTLTVVALLLESAVLVPDLGLPTVPLPVLPPLLLPPALSEPLSPLQPVTRPVCAAAGQVLSLLLLAGGAYPLPFESTDLAAGLANLLAACSTLAGTDPE